MNDKSIEYGEKADRLATLLQRIRSEPELIYWQ